MVAPNSPIALAKREAPCRRGCRGQGQRQRDGSRTRARRGSPGSMRPARGLAVDRFDGEPDRAHQQRERRSRRKRAPRRSSGTRTRCRDGRRGHAPTMPRPADQQQQIAGDHRRQHQLGRCTIASSTDLPQKSRRANSHASAMPNGMGDQGLAITATLSEEQDRRPFRGREVEHGRFTSPLWGEVGCSAARARPSGEPRPHH